MTDSMRWFTLVIIVIFLGVVYLLGPVLMPFVLSFLLAYFLDPVVTRLARWKVPRFLSAFLVFLLVVAIILAVLLSLLPALERQVVAFAHTVPAMFAWVKQTAIPWINARLHLNINIDSAAIQAAVMKHFQSGQGKLAQTVFKTVFNSGYMMIEIVMNVIMIPVITIYLLVDWVKVTTHGKDLLPFAPHKRDRAAGLIKECGDVLAGFLRGQLLVMIGSGVVYSIGLSILGLDLALLVGVLAGCLTIVPYLGFISGVLIALIATALQFPTLWHFIGVLIVFAVGVLCENFVFSPLFVGDRIGLHPVAVIFAVLAGGKLFGFVGVLLALPAAAVIMVLFRHWHNYYFSKEPEQDDAFQGVS